MKQQVIVLQPTYRHYLWGGEKLRAWGKEAPQSPLAESWEVSCRADGMSRDAETGTALDTIWRQEQDREFPLLIKLIDAAKDLSVQVHPDDAQARAIGQPFGKSECWYILQAEPGSRIALGLERETDAAALRRAAQEGNLAAYLHWIEPRVGECYFIPAGMIHALGAGVMVAEVQQNSDTTYRLYDYGRLDADGQPRPLHLEQALSVADLGKSCAQAVTVEGDFGTLCECPHFLLQKGTGERSLPVPGSFAVVIALEETQIHDAGGRLTLARGQSAFIPGSVDSVTVIPKGEYLFITEGCHA